MLHMHVLYVMYMFNDFMSKTEKKCVCVCVSHRMQSCCMCACYGSFIMRKSERFSIFFYFHETFR